jgi:adenylate cyclase
MGGPRRLLRRLISIADEPGDSDDLLLRKRMGVVAGYVTIVAPFGAPPLSGWHPLAIGLAPALSLWSAVNLVVLARTRRFERYVALLLVAGLLFTLLMNVVLGGLTSGAGVVWTFLTPVYAILALGPRRAVPWFVVFVGAVVLSVALDPWVTSTFAAPPYGIQLVTFAQNLLLPLGITFVLFYYTDVRRRAAEARSDELLTNAIPVSIATRLKRGEERIAEAYAETTVLFSDIVGFTPWTNRTDPDRVVRLLDALFSRFDDLAATCGVEKIKTIGDAYMAVAGAPEPRRDHAEAALIMARRMLASVAEWRAEHGVDLDVRIGLASGPAMAGVIGRRRILFDVWGDTVNTASRMESSGVPGRIQVAGSTRERLGDRYRFEPRQVEVKGLGRMETFLLVEEQESASR